MLARLVPDGVVDAVLTCPPTEAVNLFDSDHETPEIIWCGPMRVLLRWELTPVISAYLEGDAEADFAFPTPAWRVQYPELKGELRVGGVYVRLYMKNPNYQLKDPMRFLEHLTAEALRLIEYSLPKAAGGAGREGPAPPTPGGSSTAIAVREDDMLSILISAAVYVLRVRPGLAERSVQWGHVSRCATLLKGCNDQGVTLGGGAGLALLRLLHQLLEAPVAVDAAATVPQANLLVEFRRAIEGVDFPADTAFIFGAMAKCVRSQCRPASLKALLTPAIAGGIVEWLLEVLEDKGGKLAGVRDPDAARVHVVQILKALAKHPEVGAHVTGKLDESEKWQQYSGHRHELYLTAEHRVDYFLTNDTQNIETLLLTAGEPAPETAGAASASASGSAPPAAPAPGPSAGRSLNDLGEGEGEGEGEAKAEGPARIETYVRKAQGGFGLDLAVTNGRLRITKLKDGAENPAKNASPPLMVGDVIEIINGSSYATAKEGVSMIKGATDGLRLVVLRG